MLYLHPLVQITQVVPPLNWGTEIGKCSVLHYLFTN